MIEADDLIRALNLRPLGFEGGYFRENVRSDRQLEGTLARELGGPRDLHTAIYYLLAPDSQSLLHRLKADEVYHFYSGDPVDLLLLYPDGTSETVVLGSDLTAGHRPQQLVPAGVWQGGALQPGGRYALMGTTMSPGFHLDDFELGRFEPLAAAYPLEAPRIRKLTPTRIETARLELRAATRDLIYAELHDRPGFETGLAARVPADWPPSGHTEASLHFALDALARGVEQRDWWQWYFIDRTREPRELVGVGGFKGPPVSGAVELAYGIVAARRREGLASEAARGLLHHAQQDPRVTEVWAETDVTDSASTGVLEKVGFAPAGRDASGQSQRWRRALGRDASREG